MFLLSSGHELAVNKTVEGFNVGGVFLNALLIALDSHKFVLLGLVALSADESSAALHLAIAVCVVQLQFEG